MPKLLTTITRVDLENLFKSIIERMEWSMGKCFFNDTLRIIKLINTHFRAIVQKYLLEKSRICSQAQKERNYHVFYYLLAGANDGEKELLNLLPPHKYHYLNQV